MTPKVSGINTYDTPAAIAPSHEHFYNSFVSDDLTGETRYVVLTCGCGDVKFVKFPTS